MIEPYVPGTVVASCASSRDAHVSSTRIVAQTWWPNASARGEGIALTVTAHHPQ